MELCIELLPYFPMELCELIQTYGNQFHGKIQCEWNDNNLNDIWGATVDKTKKFVFHSQTKECKIYDPVKNAHVDCKDVKANELYITPQLKLIGSYSWESWTHHPHPHIIKVIGGAIFLKQEDEIYSVGNYKKATMIDSTFCLLLAENMISIFDVENKTMFFPNVSPWATIDYIIQGGFIYRDSRKVPNVCVVHSLCCKSFPLRLSEDIFSGLYASNGIYFAKVFVHQISWKHIQDDSYHDVFICYDSQKQYHLGNEPKESDLFIDDMQMLPDSQLWVNIRFPNGGTFPALIDLCNNTITPFFHFGWTATTTTVFCNNSILLLRYDNDKRVILLLQ